jgi:glycosyltransferase involved in cell wall biosynthesis
VNIKNVPPKVSVIIPTYNRADFLAETVDSVLNQTYGDFEIIIVDDGSTDNTYQVAQTFTDPRIKYIRQENQGLSGARNSGIRCAEAEYLAFLDSDDILFPHKLEIQVQALDDNPGIGLVAGGFLYIDEHSKPLEEQRSWVAWPNLDIDTWLFMCPFVCHSVLVRRSWVERVGMFDQNFRRCEDWDLWLRLSYAGCQMSWVENIVCGYRLHSGQMVSDAVSQKRISLAVLDKFYTNPSLPDKFLALKPEVYAFTYLSGASREYIAGQVHEARSDIEQAIQLNPHLLDDEGNQIFEVLVATVGHPLVSDPVALLKHIFANLPPSAERLKRRRREALALGAMTAFYRGHQSKDRLSVLTAFPLAVVHNPSWLRNRGAISMWIQGLLGSRFATILWRLRRGEASNTK